jgi:hypothetical protein
MIQKMFVEKTETSHLYSLKTVHTKAPILDINLEVRDKLVKKILPKENEIAIIYKNPIYKAKKNDLF